MRRRCDIWPAFLIVLLSRPLTGCYSVHTEPRTYTLDGSVPPGDALTATSPSPCFPLGADTVLLGPEPGCVEVTIDGVGDGVDPIPARGTPLRFVDATGTDLDITLRMQPQCRASTRHYMVTWLQHYCNRGPSVGGRCGDVVVSPPLELPFDELAQDGILEALVGGEGVAIHFMACAVRR